MPDPQIAPIGDSGNPTPGQSTVEQLILSSGLNRQVQVPPQTVPVHQSNPNIPQARLRQDQPERSPITGQVADVKRARRQNAVAGAVNAINNAGRMIEERHINTVKHDVGTILAATQQIDNANSILTNPASSQQDKQMAQGVIDRNKKITDDLFADKKKQKYLAKAFDISFTDPEKNNTPEVKAMQAAKKDFDKAKSSGLDYNTPEEKAIGQLANNPPQAQQQRRMITAGNNQTTTPYADQFLKKQPMALAPNPAYAGAVKQEEERQKNLTGVIKTELQQEGANNRNAETNTARVLSTQINAEERGKAASDALVAKEKQTRMIISGAMARQNAADRTKLDAVDRMNASREKILTAKTTSPQMQNKLNSDILLTLTKVNEGYEKSISNWELQKQQSNMSKETKSDIDTHINKLKSEAKANEIQMEVVQARLSAGGITNAATGYSSNERDGSSTVDGNSIGEDDDSDSELEDLSN